MVKRIESSKGGEYTHGAHQSEGPKGKTDKHFHLSPEKQLAHRIEQMLKHKEPAIGPLKAQLSHIAHEYAKKGDMKKSMLLNEFAERLGHGMSPKELAAALEKM